MIKAFNAYQINDDPSQEVIVPAEQAILELRQLLVPPTRSRESTSSRDSKPSANGTRTARVPSQKVSLMTAAPARKTARSASESVKIGKQPNMPDGTPANLSGLGCADDLDVAKRRRSSGVPVTVFDDISRLSTLLSGFPRHASRLNSKLTLRSLADLIAWSIGSRTGEGQCPQSFTGLTATPGRVTEWYVIHVSGHLKSSIIVNVARLRLSFCRAG